MTTRLHVFLVRTFKINSLSHFQIYDTVLLTVVNSHLAVHYILRPYLSCNWKFISLTTCTHFTHPSATISGNHQSALCIYKFGGVFCFCFFCIRFHIKWIIQYSSSFLTYFTFVISSKFIHGVAYGNIYIINTCFNNIKIFNNIN